MKNIYKNIGIGLTAYNRPNHLSKTLKCLSVNSNIKKIYLFCDGPKSNEEKNLKRIYKVQKIAKKNNWVKTKTIIQKKNLGLKKNTYFGMNYMFKKYEKVIFLDDDCNSAPFFVEFMATCLEKYKNVKKINSVTGYSPPIKISKSYQYDIFFTQRHCPWGFGSWRRCWKKFKKSKFNYEEILKSKSNKKLLEYSGKDLITLIANDYFGLSDSIAIRWSWFNLKSKGLNIFPKKSLIYNIGNDGSGRHSSNFKKFDTKINNNRINYNFPKNYQINQNINKKFLKFYSVKKITYMIYFYLPLTILKFVVLVYFKIKSLLNILKIKW